MKVSQFSPSLQGGLRLTPVGHRYWKSWPRAMYGKHNSSKRRAQTKITATDPLGRRLLSWPTASRTGVRHKPHTPDEDRPSTTHLQKNFSRSINHCLSPVLRISIQQKSRRRRSQHLGHNRCRFKRLNLLNPPRHFQLTEEEA